MSASQNTALEDALTKASFVRLHWVSLAGMLHSIVLPKARYLEILASDPPVYSLMRVCLTWPVNGDCVPAPSMDPMMMARPDPASLRVVEYTGGRHVSVMCDVNPTGSDETFAGWKGCPRQLVRSATRHVEEALGVDVKIGFELEMMLIDPESGGHMPTRPFPSDAFGGKMTMRGLRGKMLDIVDEVATALEAGGVPVWRYQTEMTDQLEMSLAPMSPLEAVDNVYRARETIRAIFAKHNLNVTLLPKPFLDGELPSNGCHMHLSLNPRDGSSADKKTYDSFLAGVLDQIKALFALGMPLAESYSRRFHDGAGEWIGWGTENKRVPVRGIAPNRWEFRCLDNTANAYLFLAAVLQAGLHGVRTEMPLTIADMPECPADREHKAKREAAGIKERTPESIEVALEALDNGIMGGNVELTKELGEWLLSQYAVMRKSGLKGVANMSFVKRREVYMSVLE
jgi:glutamine synthetase